MHLAVIIPTWQRLVKLKACLESLENQTTLPDLVLITVRNEDLDTLAFLKPWSALTPLKTQLVLLDKPGVIYAENQAIGLVKSIPEISIVTFMDDDAIAFPDWIQKIKNFFQHNAQAAAIGGPDIIKSEPWTYHDCSVETVGKLTAYGKVIGNHHHKSQGLRQVNALKGVNMSVRKNFLQEIDGKLQGENPAKGNGVFWELDVCLKIQQAQGTIFFDPNLLITHDSDHRHFIANSVISSTSHNLAYVLMKNLSPLKRSIFLIYAFFIGNAHIKGILKTLVEIVKTKSLRPIAEFRYSMEGFRDGILTWLR